MGTEAQQESTLRQVFPDGDIYAISDCDSVGIAAEEYGLRYLRLPDAEELPPDANVVLFLRHNLVTAALRKQFRQARVLVVPIASFDPDLEAALYSVRLVMRTDYEAACAQGRYWVDNIKDQPGPLVFSSAPAEEEAGTGAGRTDLICSFSEDLSGAAWLVPVLRPGQWVSVGSFCELSLTTRPSDDRPQPFTLDGTVVASGVLVARDPRFTPAGDARIRAARELRRELVAAAPISMRLEGGVLTEVRAGGRDFTDAVSAVTNPEHGLQALELGLGTNEGIAPEVDWRLNSQLNEGAGPVHLGFGEGVTGAHMDFVVARSTHQFLTSA